MNIPMWFIFGIPRSGTTWLGGLIAGCDAEHLVCHEAHNDDFRMDIVAPFRPWEADAYVNGPRHQRLMEYREKKKPFAHGYGEVTPRLRYFSASILRRYPQARHVHLVRDPRHAVRSLIQFGYYPAEGGRRHRRVAPDGGKWTQVQRASWAWAFGHHRIRQTTREFFRLEDLIVDFGEIRRLAAALGITINRAKWEEAKDKPANTSEQTFPAWEDWTQKDRDDLETMCGTEARHYGYLET